MKSLLRRMTKECNNQHIIMHETGTRPSTYKPSESSKNVDGCSFLQDLKGSKFSEEDLKSKCWHHRKKSDMARERWKILAKALLKPKNCLKLGKDISVRRFTCFDLVAPNKLEGRDKLDGCWVKYSAKIQNIKYSAEVHHLQQRLTARELIGFNNTGNVCIWPSEEVLTYYLLSNIHAFAGLEVLEVGGGMTCLAGVMLGKYGGLRRMDLTDGNRLSVENVQRILVKNQLDNGRIRCFQLNWSDYNKSMEKYDVVLSSDCLFFDETRSDLVETIWHSLRETGIALVLAPRRGNTLDLFLNKAVERGFLCISQTYYNDAVWKQHLKFKESRAEYDEDIHYPILLMMTKSSQGFPIQNCLSALKH